VDLRAVDVEVQSKNTGRSSRTTDGLQDPELQLSVIKC